MESHPGKRSWKCGKPEFSLHLEKKTSLNRSLRRQKHTKTPKVVVQLATQRDHGSQVYIFLGGLPKVNLTQRYRDDICFLKYNCDDFGGCSRYSRSNFGMAVVKITG